MDTQGHESYRGYYLEAWSGKQSKVVDRIGRGTIYTLNHCLSIFGTTQPDKLINWLCGAVLRQQNDGLIQRFQLMVYPDLFPINM